MIEMNFMSFLVLLVISVAVSAVLHFVCKYYVRPGLNSFLSKVIFGYIGAWQGPQVFGKWFDGMTCEGIYYIPAILGSLALLVVMIDLTKSVKGVSGK